MKYTRVGYIDSSFLTVRSLLQEFSLDATYSFIKHNMAIYPSYPALSTQDFSKLIYDIFKIENEIVMLDASNLGSVQFPAIIYYEFNEGCFVLILEQTDSQVRLKHPYIGEMILTIDEFARYWKGIAILITDYDPDFQQLDFESEFTTEKNEIEWFRDNGVRLIPDYLNIKECDELISFIEKNARGHKDSSNFSIGPHPLKSIFEKIVSKTECLVNISRSHFEDIICIQYLEGHLNSLHYDILSEEMGKHIYSLIIYLNDNFEAGQTCFPQVGIKIRPKKGAALLFRNFDSSIMALDCSVHAGLPTSSGVKYTCNVWISSSPLNII